MIRVTLAVTSNEAVLVLLKLKDSMPISAAFIPDLSSGRVRGGVPQRVQKVHAGPACGSKNVGFLFIRVHFRSFSPIFWFSCGVLRTDFSLRRF